jgi:hypothetical protein
MYTDFYLLNSAAGHPVTVAFYQQYTAPATPGSRVFQLIRKCPYGWSHRVRIPWNLSFRLVRSSGNATEAALLKTTYRTERDRILIAKDGIVTVRQSYGNGKQLIVVEQTKGTAYAAVQVYRGSLLVAEAPFGAISACFQIDAVISVLEQHPGQESMMIPEQGYPLALNIDLTGLKTVHLSLTAGTASGSRLIVGDTKKW